jgi:3-keto-5-aminohexanoate cleavage enzyme
MEKLVITAAITGAFLSKEQHPGLPVTPEEIAAEVKRCYDAGATIAHLHARHPDRSLSDYQVLGTTIKMINELCPIITQVGTGVRDRFGEIRTEEDRLKNFLDSIDPAPDMITINSGSFHFRVLGKKEPMGSKGRSYLYSNSPELIEGFTEGAISRGLGIEFETFDAGQVPATPKALMYMVDAIPPGAHWTAMGISRRQAPITTMAMILGGGVRVGFEDNVYLYKGVLAKSNAEFVDRVVNTAKVIGREVATVEEAREILHL